jgi:hypothetical protein
MTGTLHSSEAKIMPGAGGRPLPVTTPISACRAREAACLVLLGLAAADGGATVEEAAAVLAHVAAGDWHPPADLLCTAAERLLDTAHARAMADGRFQATPAGCEALDCLLTAPVPAPVDAVTRVVLSLRLCLLDRLPPEARAMQADALASAYGAVLDRRYVEAERFCNGMPLLGLWSRERGRRLEAERELCARVRDLFAFSGPGEAMAASG